MGVEEVDAVDRLAFDRPRLGEPVEGVHPGGEIVERGEMGEVAPVAGQQDLAKVDQAVDGFLEEAMARVAGPSRCSTFRWRLKKDTSSVVVSIRRMQPNLSYILIEALPKWYLMQVPSIRVEN